eukprot:809104-Pelagomonas_calceolata.AAC.9
MPMYTCPNLFGHLQPAQFRAHGKSSVTCFQHPRQLPPGPASQCTSSSLPRKQHVRGFRDLN